MSRRIVNLLALLGAFLAGTLLAELFGAANTGIALSFGQLAFAATLLFILLRR